ncbi:hypothetical protein HJFPF1_02511 [Paramyrothecium foliicola]|nr:hypothetical protein HJFPF1_02511 [Paramyrothecium foliicola]
MSVKLILVSQKPPSALDFPCLLRLRIRFVVYYWCTTTGWLQEGQQTIAECGGCEWEEKSQRLRRFLLYSKNEILACESAIDIVENFANRDPVIHSLKLLRKHPDTQRDELCREAVGPAGAGPVLVAQNDLMNLAIKVMIMTDCSPVDYSADKLETGSLRTQWKGDVPLSKFVQDIFPVEAHPVLAFPENDEYWDFRSNLTATKLKKHLGIAFRPTSDIRNHLKLDRRSNALEIFHHTAFLKEHLKLSKDQPKTLVSSDSLKLGTLPRQLVLEILDSVQGILFPLSEKKSCRLLEALVKTDSFDPDMLRFEFSSIRNNGEEHIPYFYLAGRLSELHDELQSPRPRGWIERRLERRSGARYMMLATLIGVAFAVLLGIGSLAVGCFQTWIAYQAWKHPTTSQ